MKITGMKYMVSLNCLADDLEGNIIFCKTIEEAKNRGVNWADYESDPFFTIWQNVGAGEWIPVLEGFIPEPEFSWHEPQD